MYFKAMSQKSRVALVRCTTYDLPAVRDAVRLGLDHLGGTGRFVDGSGPLLLKPNGLMGRPPEQHATTHPAVFQAVAELFTQAGAKVSYGDSPGGIFGVAPHMKRSGFESVARSLQIPLADFDHGTETPHPDGKIAKRLLIADGVLEAAGVVSLPKLKTHGFTRLTGAVKNQYGCIPGPAKGEYHARYSDIEHFARLIADVTSLVRPRLYIMDAVTAMEGNGPQSGDPKQMSVLLFSTDPVAMDSVACELVGLNTEYVPTIRAAEEVGLGTSSPERIEIVGEPLGAVRDTSFRIQRRPPDVLPRGFLSKFLRTQTIPRPVIDPSKCTRCGTCVRSCPVSPKAVDWRGGNRKVPPVYSYERCIRCYCCQEMCPERAIQIKRPFLVRLTPAAMYIMLLVQNIFHKHETKQ
jgi:uncharacterized protein (DUF362 family)/Pyruvate/2-oxoacid:ferredoxin oxidoreductase delta subunit